ncbi:hypothetical protein I3842_04G040700 [Carya illinoinensis]|uniref:Uncharacterized protein n=1 Tax=Carya illinoinensis TaxID=32201 RepID=A0A922F6H4_CARIL|nr:hypothetical protein I3842_04G040700 [Carya illinoinensis]
MASTMEQSHLRDESEFSLREWALKARTSRENTNSRRFSASNIRSFREDTRSFRSNITISSTASSPGYSLKALQARSGYYSWECLSPEGFALNSKWNEAEKYICNPLSGEVPMECLSAKTLSGRSFRNLTNRITMSAPLIYSSHSRQFQTKPTTSVHEGLVLQLPIPENKAEGMTRDVGTQSTLPDLSSSSPSPASTPSIIERAMNRYGLEDGDSPHSHAKITKEEVEVKETSDTEETKREKEKEERKEKDEETCRQGGCLSWMTKKRQRGKQKTRIYNIFLTHLKGC